MSPTFRAFKVRNFRLYASGAIVSNVGTWMQRTAQDWLVLTQLTDHSATAVGIVLGVAVPVAGAAVVIGAAGGSAAARSRLGDVERTQVALEQVLDRAEHGEFEPSRTLHGSRESPFGRLAEEIRKSFGV